MGFEINFMRLRSLLTCVLFTGLLPLTAGASPINFNYQYTLTATTNDGRSVTGTFEFNPATQTFVSNQWAFNLHAGPTTVSDANNGVTFQNPDTHINGELAYTDGTATVINYGPLDYVPNSGPEVVYPAAAWFEFDQGAGTGLNGWGSSSVQSSLVLMFDALPFSYTDPAGNILDASGFAQGPDLGAAAPDFYDYLSGTVTLQAGQSLPTPVTTPEPATWALLGTGALLLAGVALSEERRRRQAAA